MQNPAVAQNNFTASRRNFLIGSSALVLTAAIATKARAMLPSVFITDGWAVGGYDAVAYFTTNSAVPGKNSHSLTWEGNRYRFSSAANKAAFEADPERYAPQYGGYCAYAVSQGGTAAGSPTAWTVHNDKLYLNLNKAVRTLWSTRRKRNIRLADENWPSVLG